MRSDAIVAEPATITASIGVFVMWPVATDLLSVNPGTYYGTCTLGASGALTSPNNTAMSCAANGYMEVNRTIGDNFTIEFWMNATSGTGTGTNWYDGAGLVDASPPLAAVLGGFGVGVRSDGKITIDEFAKVDLRVGLVKVAERVPKSDKLLRLD